MFYKGCIGIIFSYSLLKDIAYIYIYLYIDTEIDRLIYPLFLIY